MRADLLDVLRGKGYDILWTVLGEQRILIHGGPRQYQNLGWYDLWGAWIEVRGRWVGALRRAPTGRGTPAEPEGRGSTTEADPV